MNVLVFDIETIPDTDAGARLYGIDGLSAADIAKIMFQRRRDEAGTDFLRHYLHRIIAISVLLRRDGHTQLVYKHAISTVMPGAPIQLFDATKAAETGGNTLTMPQRELAPASGD